METTTTTFEERLNGLNGDAQAQAAPAPVQPAPVQTAPVQAQDDVTQWQRAQLRQDYAYARRAELDALYMKVNTGELDIDAPETQDMFAVQFCRLQNVDPTRLFAGDELSKTLSNGEFPNRRELGRAVFEMLNTAASMDYSGRQMFDAAQETGDRSKLIEACNKLAYGDNTEAYRNDWSEHEIGRIRRSTKQKDLLYGFLGTNFDSLSEAGKAGFVGAVLMSRGKSTDDLVECGLYKDLNDREKVDALLITEMLRSGHTAGFMDFAREASRIVDAPVNVAKGAWQIVDPSDVGQGLRVSELLEANGGIEEALKKPAVRSKLVEELDSWSTPFHFWTDSEIRRKATAAKRLGDSELARRRMLKLAESIAGSPKLLETGEAMRYALEAAGTAAEMTGQLGVQIGAIALGGVAAGPGGSFLASTATIALMESGDSYWDYQIQGMSQQDAAILAVSTGAAVGALNTIGFKMISPTLVGKVTQTAAQKSLLNAGVKIGGNVSAQAAKLAQGAGVRAGVIGKIGSGLKQWGKAYLIEGSQEVLEEAIVSSIELSSDYWRNDGQDLFNLGTELDEIADTAVYMAKYGMWSVLPMSVGEAVAKRKSKPVQRVLGVAASADGKGVEAVKGGVSIVDASAAERAAQAYNDARQQATAQGIPSGAANAWSPELTGEQRAELKKKYKLTDAQVETLDAMVHYKRLARELGDTSIDVENEIKELNAELDKMSKEEKQQVIDELNAESTTQEAPDANADADAKPAATANEATAPAPARRKVVGTDGQIYEENAAPETNPNEAGGNTTRFVGADGQVSNEPTAAAARFNAEKGNNGGGDVRFSAGAAFAPAGNVPVSRKVSEAKKKLRDKLLTHISSKAGVKVVRLTSAEIEKRLNRKDASPRYSAISHGELVYGYYDSAKRELVLNEDFADFDTPIHEWTHVWWDWVKQNDPRIIERIVYWVRMTEEYKKLRGQALADKNSVYHDLANREEALVQEVFARLCGKKGEEIMSQEGVGTWAKIRRCVLDFYKGLLRTLGLSDDEVHRLTFEDLQGMCLRDLFDNETLGLKGVRARISTRGILNDAIDNAEIDEAIKDAGRKRLIRNASVLVAAKLLRRRGFMSAKEVDAAHDEILADIRKALPTESSDVHEAVFKVASLYAKMVYSTREATAEAITDAAQAVHEISRVQQELRSERILTAAFKKGVIGAELYAEAKEYVDRYTKMTETGRGSKEPGLTWEETNSIFGDGARAIISALFDKNAAESVTRRIARAVEERLGANAKPWDVLQATRRTLARSFKRVAKTWVHSAAREQALKAIEAIEDADNMDALMKAAEKAEGILREKGIKLTTRALIGQIAEFVKRAEARIGDSRQVADKRKYSGEFSEFVKAFAAHFKALASAAEKIARASDKTHKGRPPAEVGKLIDQAQKIREEMQRELRDIVNRIESAEDSAETRGLQARLQALTLLAGVDFTNVEQLSQLFETLSEAERSDAEMKFGEKSRFAEAVANDAKKLTEFVNARTDKTEYDNEAGFGRKAFSWIGNYVFNMKQRFEQITAFAKGADRAKRNAMLKRLHRQEVEANLRKEKEKHRRLFKFRKMLEELGYDTDSKIKAFSKKLSEARADLARFSYSGSVAMSYDQLLNLYLGLRQSHVSAALLAMDADTRNAFFKKNADAKILWRQIEMMNDMKSVLENEKILEYGNGLCELIAEERTRINEACAQYFGMNLMMFPEDAAYFPISRMKKEGLSLQTTGTQSNVVPSAVLPRIPNMRSLDTAVGATAAFMHHVEEVEHFVAYGKLSRYYTALFSDKDFCRAVYLKFGEKALSNLRNAVADTINGQFYKNDDLGASKFANTAVNISSVLMLGWNVGTALKQVSSFWVFANEIGWKNAFLAMCYNDEQGYRARINEMMAHPLWHARYAGKGSAKYMQELMSHEKHTGWWKTYSRMAMSTVRFGDAVAVLIVGHGLYGATKASLMRRLNPRTGKLFTEEEASDMAMATVMDIADRTQQAGRTANFNVAQRRGSSLSRIIGQFQSSLGQMMGAEIAAAYDLRAQGWRSVEARRKLISTMVNNHIIIPGLTWAATLLIKYLFKQEPPDEDDAYELIAAILLGQAGGLFLVGGFATSLFSTNSMFLQANFPVMSSVSKLLGDGKKFAKSCVDGKRKSTTKATASFLSDLSAVTREAVQLTDTYIVDLDGKK